VPVADAASFSWAGPWIARRSARDRSGPRAVVMFGVPPGPIWDPADTTDEILDGYIVAPLDLAAWPPRPAAEAGIGVVEALVVAPAAEAPVALVDEALAIAGRGLEGDRYATGAGTFAPADQAATSRSSTPPSSTHSTATSTTAATSSYEEPTSTRSWAASSCSATRAAAAAACANRAPTSTASTAAVSCDRSCTAADCARTSSPTAPCASATN
jgi:hypothetical protein